MSKTFKRYEKKYLLSEVDFENLMAKFTHYMKPDKFCRDGRYYTIYNIYFDTENHDIIRHSLSKPYYKEKLRLRSYTVPVNPNDPVFLELKKKIGGVVSKRRAEITCAEAFDFVEKGIRPEKGDYLNEQVIKEIAQLLKHNTVMPKVFISYERMAFFGKENKDFRVTFDSNIKTRRSHLLLEEGAWGRNLIPENQYLMEIKIPGAIPLWLSQTLSENQIYSTSFSKYGAEYKNYCRQNPVKSFKIPDIPVFQPYILPPGCAVH